MPSCDTIAAAAAVNSGAVSPHPPPLLQEDAAKPAANDEEGTNHKITKTEKKQKSKSNSTTSNGNKDPPPPPPPPTFASTVMSNFIKIFLTCGVYFWYLAARAVLDTVVETAKNLYESHRAHLDDIQERMCENHVNELYHGSRRRAAARRLHLSKDDSHLFAESSSDGTIKLRLRHSLRKRKEQIIFGSPRSPASPASPTSGSSSSQSPTSPASPSSPVEKVNSLAYHQQLNGINCRRAR